MFEIELKAHVDDRKSVIEKLNGFASFLGAVQKDDVYWGKFDGEKKIQARIRKETPFNSDEVPFATKGEEHIFLTYKRKEIRTASDGTSCEVNDEKECTMSDAAALESLFSDLGLSVMLEKHKTVLGWSFEQLHLELCTVPPLGDFLEIETFAESNEPEIVLPLRKKLIESLKKCGIMEEKIENKYYSELLRENASKEKKSV